MVPCRQMLWRILLIWMCCDWRTINFRGAFRLPCVPWFHLALIVTRLHVTAVDLVLSNNVRENGFHILAPVVTASTASARFVESTKVASSTRHASFHTTAFYLPHNHPCKSIHQEGSTVCLGVPVVGRAQGARLFPSLSFFFRS